MKSGRATPTLRARQYVDGKPRPHYRGFLHQAVTVVVFIALLMMIELAVELFLHYSRGSGS